MNFGQAELERVISPDLLSTLGCGCVCAQVAASQPGDVGLSFVDVSSQRGGFQLGILLSQPAQLADRLVPHFTQSPDQLIGLGDITFPNHRRMVSPVGVLRNPTRGMTTISG